MPCGPRARRRAASAPLRHPAATPGSVLRRSPSRRISGRGIRSASCSRRRGSRCRASAGGVPCRPLGSAVLYRSRSHADERAVIRHRSQRPSRRTFVKGLAMAAPPRASAGCASRLGPGAAAARSGRARRAPTFDLRIGETAVNVTGRTRTAHDHQRLAARAAAALARRRHRARCASPTRSTKTPRSTGTASSCRPTWTACPASASPASIPATTYDYRFTVKQNGTYWYHSHSGFQEQHGRLRAARHRAARARAVPLRPRARRDADRLDRRERRARVRAS